MIRLRLLGMAAALAAFAGIASAAAPVPPQKELTGTLKRIKDSGVVRMGYRDSAVPLSYLDREGRPAGYSIDLCLAIAEEIAASIGGRRPRFEFYLVTPETRIEQIVNGRLDLECGATSNTEERRARVAFSPVIFVAGTRLMVKRGSSIHSMRDLEGRSLVAVAATSNARAMLALGPGKVRNLRLVHASGYNEAFAMLEAGLVEAMAADDVLIEAFLAERNLRERYIMVGSPLTHEPYGIMFARDDPGIAHMVQAAFERLATTGELRRLYDRWFVGTLPSGRKLGIPMNAMLVKEFQALGMAP
jgi:glutamate/aspartate transport system substrate-binding protein